MVGIDNGKSRKKSILPTRSKLIYRFSNKEKSYPNIYLKACVKRQKLQDTETLEARIVDAAYNIPTKYLHNIALHSKNHFEICLNKKPNLNV
jgi:hypothetical protein